MKDTLLALLSRGLSRGRRKEVCTERRKFSKEVVVALFEYIKEI